MSIIYRLSLIALFCATLGHTISPGRPGRVGLGFPEGMEPEFLGLPREDTNVSKDVPLTVRLVKVGDRYAMFNITGKDTVNGKPIKTLFVNYTTDGPTVQVEIKEVSSSNSNGEFNRVVQVVGLTPGLDYVMQFSGENADGQRGPRSSPVAALLLPPTPDISVQHPSLQKLKVIWAEKRTTREDYYTITVEKKSNPGCGLTVNLTSCFGNSYSLDDLEVGQVYRLIVRAHNPSGFSDPVVVSYPIE